jgi:hypothetical protein
VLTASIIRAINTHAFTYRPEAVSNSETSENFYQTTRRNIPNTVIFQYSLSVQRGPRITDEVKAANSFLQVKLRQTDYVILLYVYCFTSNVINSGFVGNYIKDDRQLRDNDYPRTLASSRPQSAARGRHTTR